MGLATTYVVFVGRRPGIYNEWYQCSQQVYRYKGAVYEKYDTYEEAEMAFLDFWEMSSDHPPHSSRDGSHHSRQLPIVNEEAQAEGGTRDESKIRYENTMIMIIMIIFLLVLICLILSLKILFG